MGRSHQAQTAAVETQKRVQGTGSGEEFRTGKGNEAEFGFYLNHCNTKNEPAKFSKALLV